jgi:hypothetical protein
MAVFRTFCTAFAVTLASATATVAAPVVYEHTIDSGPGIGATVNRPGSVSFLFPGTPAPGAGGVLTVTAFGDINGQTEIVDVFAEGFFIGTLFDAPTVEQDPIELTDSLSISLDDLTAITADGEATFMLVVPSTSGAAFVQFNSLRLAYDVQSAVPEPVAPLWAAVAVLLAWRWRSRSRSLSRKKWRIAAHFRRITLAWRASCASLFSWTRTRG